jgi:hypothetical protein
MGDESPERRGAREAGDDIERAVRRASEVAGGAIARAGELAGAALSGLFGGGDRSASAHDLSSSVLPGFPPPLAATAGEELELGVTLVSAADRSSEPFGYTAADLVSEAGDRIPADAIALPPYQRVLAAGLSDRERVTVSVPAGTKPGVYRGELRPTDGEAVAPVALAVEVR